MWELHDPEHIPTRRHILERDECRCRVPGCPRRARMQDHHAEFRSRGGTDKAENRGMVCAVHHRQIHEGLLKVTGKAPGARRWEMGLRPGLPPLRVLVGERIIENRLP